MDGRRLLECHGGIAEANYDGVARVLLCLIVQGLPAGVYAGSDQSYTRANELKSAGGVDLLSNPSWCVIWCENMNPCIFPLCVVSFRKRPTLRYLGPAPSCIPVTVDMRKLRREIKRFLTSSMLQQLEDYFNDDTVIGILLKVFFSCKHFKLDSSFRLLVGAYISVTPDREKSLENRIMAYNHLPLYLS